MSLGKSPIRLTQLYLVPCLNKIGRYINLVPSNRYVSMANHLPGLWTALSPTQPVNNVIQPTLQK